MNDTDSNIGKLILERASAYPDRVVISVDHPHRRITYQQLRDRSLQFAVQLRKRGVKRGARLVLTTKLPFNSYCAMIAIALLGATWLKPSNRLARGDLRITHILLDAVDPVLSSDRRAVVIDRDWNRPIGADADALLASFPGPISGDDLAVISESSGTTGTSKLIPLSYHIRSLRTFAERDFETAGPIISLNMFPVNGAGTSNIDLRVLLGGGTIVHGGDYASWLERGVNQVSASPAQVVRRIFGNPAPNEGEPRIPRLWVRGSKPSRQFFDTAFAYFDDVVVGYGASEVGGIVYQIITRENVDASGDELGSIFPYARVEIVDDDDKPLPADTAGIVRVQSNAQIAGYLNDSEATAKAFRNGWFYPGDLGKLSAAGALNILGRLNDQFNLAGIKVSAIRVDEALQAIDGVREAMSFVIPDASGIDVLGALIVPAEGLDEAALATKIKDECTTSLGPSRTPRRLYATAELPLNDNGKPVRGQAAASLDQYRRLF